MAYYIFCEVAWMKYYGGVTENDKPRNGGKFIDENEDGGEVFNFSPYNHKCYGYVMHYGEMHIEHFDKKLKNSPKAKNVTVIFVASDGIESKIVGWYENAIMFREWQSVLIGSEYYDYNFLADEKSCYLIEEKKRNFTIPRATQAGKGRGMGRSQVWYADSEYAQSVFIPKVQKYLNSIKTSCEPFYYTKEDLSIKAKDNGQTVEQLIHASDMEQNYLKSLSYLNLAVAKDDCCLTRWKRGDHLALKYYLDEAEEDYKMALQFEDNLTVMFNLMDIESALDHDSIAIEIGERIRRRKVGFDNWPNCADLLTALYLDEKEYDQAEALMNECELEADGAKHKEWIAEFRKVLKNARRNKKQ